MWLRVDRAGGKASFVDNMADRPVREARWSACEIEGDVHDDAEQIDIGLMLVRSGTAWLDDLVLEVVGEPAWANAEPPRPLEGRGLENLVAWSSGATAGSQARRSLRSTRAAACGSIRPRIPLPPRCRFSPRRSS
jgi:hypothetical protein